MPDHFTICTDADEANVGAWGTDIIRKNTWPV